MVKTLVLMRHGEAERFAASGDDADRALTKAGHRALEAMFPQVVCLLETDSPVRVWTSPLVRARQTACLLSSSLGEEEPSVHPLLASGDVDGFLDEVACCDGRTVVAVGHNPFVEQLAVRLGAVALPFGKGALASFRLADDAANGELLWFVQGLRARRWETLLGLEDAFAHAARRVWKSRKRFLSRPDDPKRLHAFRISIRTMRSLLSFAEPFQGTSWNGSLQKDLRSMVRQTSRLRDLDVLCDRAREASGLVAEPLSEGAKEPQLPTDSSASGLAAEGLEAVLVQMRDKERDRVVAALGGRRLRRAARRVRRLGKNVMWCKRVEREGLAKKDLRTRFFELVAVFQSDCEDLDPSDFAALHSLRKKAKLLRYVANELGPLVGEEARELVGQMASLQDELGSVCDAWASRQTIASMDKRVLTESGSRELALIEEEDAHRLRSLS